ncbi:MAG TPA: hypothetical protein VFV86_05140 [Nitrososphaeraceae archaeon]|nr:hypothetical protein [Nitrososphaeraceae archaeon]
MKTLLQIINEIKMLGGVTPDMVWEIWNKKWDKLTNESGNRYRYPKELYYILEKYGFKDGTIIYWLETLSKNNLNKVYSDLLKIQ